MPKNPSSSNQDLCLGLMPPGNGDFAQENSLISIANWYKDMLPEIFSRVPKLKHPDRLKSDLAYMTALAGIRLGTRILAPAAETTLVGQTQIAMQPTKLIIDEALAQHFAIIDIKMGRNSQIAGAGRLPATAFNGHMEQSYRFDAIAISMLVQVTIVNISDVPRSVPHAMIVGQPLPSPVLS
jgi:hypothetical protein